MKKNTLNRREFLKKSSITTLGVGGLLTFPLSSVATERSSLDEMNIVGPKEGFTPQIGTLVSMMNWMRTVVLDLLHKH